MSSVGESWSVPDEYEGYIGRWSRLVAREFLGWLDVDAGRRWLDVGCGTGVLSETILQTALPASLIGIDPAEPYVQHARSRISDDRASFLVGDAQDLPSDLTGFDAVVAGLVLNFIPDLDLALSGMGRAARDGGTVAAYVWDYAEGMELLRLFFDVAVTIDPDSARHDEGLRFPICRPDGLAELFSRHFAQVAVTEIVVPTRFRDFDDYWRPFLGGQGVAPRYVMSLSEDVRIRLREALRERLPTAPDGSIALRARAWAVRGLAHR